MIKEKLEARLTQLQQERLASLAAYDGAIQDCNYWLQELNKDTDVQADISEPSQSTE